MNWYVPGTRPQWTCVGLLGFLAGMNKYRDVGLSGANGLSTFTYEKVFSIVDDTKKLAASNIEYWNSFGDDIKIPGVRQVAQGYGKLNAGINQALSKAADLSPFDGSVMTIDRMYGQKGSFYTAIELSKEIKAVKRAGVAVSLGASVGTDGSQAVTDVDAYARAKLTLDFEQLKALITDASKGLKDALQKVSRKAPKNGDRDKAAGEATKTENIKKMALAIFEFLPEFELNCEVMVFLGINFKDGLKPYLRICTHNSVKGSLTVQIKPDLLKKFSVPSSIMNLVPKQYHTIEVKKEIAEAKGSVENWNLNGTFNMQAGFAIRKGVPSLDLTKAVAGFAFEPGGRSWQVQLMNIAAHMPKSFS